MSSDSKATASLPSDETIRKTMERLVPTVDLETITTKQFIAMLSKEMGGHDLSSKKKYIKATLTEVLDAMDENDDEGTVSDTDDQSQSDGEEEDEPPTKKRKTGGGGLTLVKEISDELADFLGMGKQMARTEVVKSLWAYIKENNLQNPNDKREILLDEKMKSLFKCDKFTMFTMNKYVGSHIHPFTPVNLEELSENSKKKKEEAAVKRRAKKEGKKASRKGIKRKHQGTQQPWRLSPELAALVGKDILPRPQVSQALWVYIKKNKLQKNPKDKREIFCDETLKSIMGGEDKVTIFTMNRLITPHLVEKLDKSAYVHEEIEKVKTEDQHSS